MANLGLALAGGQIAGGLTEAMRYAEQERLKRQYMGLQEREQATAERSLGLREQYEGAQIKQMEEASKREERRLGLEEQKYKDEEQTRQIKDSLLKFSAADVYRTYGRTDLLEKTIGADPGSYREFKDKEGNPISAAYAVQGKPNFVDPDSFQKLTGVAKKRKVTVDGQTFEVGEGEAFDYASKMALEELHGRLAQKAATAGTQGQDEFARFKMFNTALNTWFDDIDKNARYLNNAYIDEFGMMKYPDTVSQQTYQDMIRIAQGLKWQMIDYFNKTGKLPPFPDFNEIEAAAKQGKQQPSTTAAPKKEGQGYTEKKLTTPGGVNFTVRQTQ